MLMLEDRGERARARVVKAVRRRRGGSLEMLLRDCRWFEVDGGIEGMLSNVRTRLKLRDIF